MVKMSQHVMEQQIGQEDSALPEPGEIDLDQIIYALQRQITILDKWTNDLAEEGDYNCMFYEEDANRLREAIEIINQEAQKL